MERYTIRSRRISAMLRFDAPYFPDDAAQQLARSGNARVTYLE